MQRNGPIHIPFARNEVRSPKIEVKLQFQNRPAQLFRIAENCDGKIALLRSSAVTLLCISVSNFLNKILCL